MSSLKTILGPVAKARSLPLPTVPVAADLAKTVTAFMKTEVGRTPYQIPLTENKYRLLRFHRPDEEPRCRPGTMPVLLVPSLINKWYVLDLLPEQSFAAFLLEQGHDVYIIDWGTPGPEDRYLELDHYIERYLARCVRTILRLSGAPQVHLLGYCLGGTLSTIYAALHPQMVRSKIALAAPIGFKDDGLLSVWMNTKNFNVDLLADAFGNIPWPLMQASFYMLKPTLQLAKTVNLFDRVDNEGWLRVFAAIETWGNDNVSFPGGAFRKYINDLYRSNGLVEGRLNVGGRAVRLEALCSPLMVVSFAHDHIVPEQSARCLLDLAGSEIKEDVVQAGGHVGAMVGKRAREGIWSQMSTFFKRFDGQPELAV